MVSLRQPTTVKSQEDIGTTSNEMIKIMILLVQFLSRLKKSNTKDMKLRNKNPHMYNLDNRQEPLN